MLKRVWLGNCIRRVRMVAHGKQERIEKETRLEPKTLRCVNVGFK